MLGFPQTTEFNKRIPKQKFYENMDVSSALRRVFVDKIKLIHWRNKIAPTTINIAPGETVNEIEVIEIKLNQWSLDEAVLRRIDMAIPYHILFVLSYESKVQAWAGYKEAAKDNNAIKSVKYYHTEWMPEGELTFKVEGLNMDTLWNNLIMQVGNIELKNGNSLDEQIAVYERISELQKNIDRLEKQARAEKQPKKKFEIVSQIRVLQKQLREL